MGPSKCGKSTQAVLLYNSLRYLKIPGIYRYLKSFHTPVYQLLKLMLILIPCNKKQISTLLKLNPMFALFLLKPQLVKKKLLIKTFSLFEELSFLLLDIFSVRIPATLGKVVIVDEYIPGRINDYLSSMLRKSRLTKFLIKLNLAMLPRNIILIYLSCSYDVSKERALLHNKVPEPKNYFTNWQKTYLLIKKIYPYIQTICMNTNSSTEIKVHNLILRKILLRINRIVGIRL